MDLRADPPGTADWIRRWRSGHAARRYRVLRKTVVKALNHPVPPVRKSSPPRVSVLKRVEGFIDEMLLLIPHVVVKLGS